MRWLVPNIEEPMRVEENFFFRIIEKLQRVDINKQTLPSNKLLLTSSFESPFL